MSLEPQHYTKFTFKLPAKYAEYKLSCCVTDKCHFIDCTVTHNKGMPGAGADISLVLVELSHMYLQTASTGEFLRTLAAFVITYTSVCCNVPFQVTHSKRPFPTNLTLVWVVASVCGFVEVQEVDSCKSLAAVQTCVVMRCREDRV